MRSATDRDKDAMVDKNAAAPLAVTPALPTLSPPTLSPVHLFVGATGPIRVSGLDRLGVAAAEILSGWPGLGTARADPATPVDAEIEDGPDGLRLIQLSPVRAVTDFADPHDAALGLFGALIAAYLAQDPTLLCFHAAASRLERGLVLMLGATNAGKSTLAAHLIERRLISFGDDRILLSPDARGRDQGICLALPHKLRLPLPQDASAGFAAFVGARAVPGSHGVMRLRLKHSETETFGARAPLAAFVLIERRTGNPATLDPAPSASVVRELVRQSFAPQLGADAILAEALGLAARVPGYRLVYGRSSEAAELIATRFGGAGTGAGTGVGSLGDAS
jgi:hypothetical protein